MVCFLASQNGPHSAEQWAGITAQTIFAVDPTLAGQRLTDSAQLSRDITTALADHYGELQVKESAALTHDANRCTVPLDVKDAAHDALDAVKWCSVSTPWEALLHSVEWTESALAVLLNHMLTITHIERLWHADTHPENEAAQIYKAKHGNI